MKKSTSLTISSLLLASVIGTASVTAWANKDASDAAEIKAALKAPVNISQAIKAAETATGGTAYAAEFDKSESKSGFYEVDTMLGNKLASVNIDAGTGKELADQEVNDDQQATTDDDIVDTASLGVKLGDVASQAAQRTGGKVMAIGFGSPDGGTPQIEFEIALNNGTTASYYMAKDSGKLSQFTDSDHTDRDHDQEDEDGDHD